MNENFIKRDILVDLQAHLDKKEITMIIGPRQCGKTTMMNLLVQELKQKNKKILFLNLDVENDQKYFISQKKLLDKIKLEFGTKSGYVFIDEIQKKTQAGNFLKGIYDMNLPYKIIVSGSGNIEIKEKISESLMGRKRLFLMRPVNFLEFVNFKTDYRYENKLKDFFTVELENAEELFLEYLNFGGYPRIITNISLAEKSAEINEIYQSYLNQDIVKWLQVEKISAFEKLIKLSAVQIGNLVEYSNLATAVNLSTETVQNYLWYLRKTFVIKSIRPFFRNKKKEIVKSPIFYFYDLGLRNYLLNKFGQITEFSNDIGFLFENFVANELGEKIKNSNLQINFWRTKSQAEVDFVLDLGQEVIPIEVKFKNFTQPKIEKSLQSFIKKYQPQQALVVTKNFSAQIKFAETEVNFIRFFEIDKIFNYSIK